MNLIINEYNLQPTQIEEYNEKVRALIINNKNELLIANYGGTYLLPGGSIEKDEEIIQALIRELKEETGINYNINELEYLCTLEYYQKNYPKRNNNIKNRLITTYYYITTYKEISKNIQLLTENELKGNFKLELISLENIENLINENQTNNPRNIYFQKELLSVINFYKEKIQK